MRIGSPSLGVSVIARRAVGTSATASASSVRLRIAASTIFIS
jgi:hypothetical protein